MIDLQLFAKSTAFAIATVLAGSAYAANLNPFTVEPPGPKNAFIADVINGNFF